MRSAICLHIVEVTGANPPGKALQVSSSCRFKCRMFFGVWVYELIVRVRVEIVVLPSANHSYGSVWLQPNSLVVH